MLEEHSQAAQQMLLDGLLNRDAHLADRKVRVSYFCRQTVPGQQELLLLYKKACVRMQDHLCC